MINISELFQFVLYILLIVLVVALIVLVMNTIKTLNKIDKLVDDIALKSSKLDSAFDIIGGATGAVVNFNDNITNFITRSLRKIFNRKRDKNE